ERFANAAAGAGHQRLASAERERRIGHGSDFPRVSARDPALYTNSAFPDPAARMTDRNITGNPAGHLTAEARRLARAARWREAEVVVGCLIAETFGLPVAAVEINRDRYSLNSLNGFVTASDGRALFFKFHQEEGEADTVGEYYRAEVLRDAGFPVDLPLHASGEVGRQILPYRPRS